MKGDFTRFTFNSDKHYTGVYMQQGRLQLDSDWNEQVAIQNYLSQIQCQDVIGISGIPDTEDNKNAFKIDPIPGKDDFKVTPGRIYVDGILCQLSQLITYRHQLNYPNADIPENPAQDTRYYLVYLDVWERHLTAIEDPEIREIALNGPDTTTRTKTIVQVKLLPLSIAQKPEENIQEWRNTIDSAWEKFIDAQKKRQPTLEAAKVDSARITENHLYRVEIHTPGSYEKATFKWSRDNGTVVSEIEKIKDDVITIRQRSHEAWQSSQPNQWIEITDEKHELAGKPGTLTCLKQVLDNQLVFDNTRIIGEPLSEYQEPGLKVRRWDYTSDTVTAGIPIKSQAADGWIVLGENEGIQIKFNRKPEDLRDIEYWETGDYWLIPTRAATNSIEWIYQTPQAPDNSNLNAQIDLGKPYEGIHHHYCRLAVLEYLNSSFSIKDDFQKEILFSPLTKPSPLLYIQANKLAVQANKPKQPKTPDKPPKIFGHSGDSADPRVVTDVHEETFHPGDLITIPAKNLTALITRIVDDTILEVYPSIGSQLPSLAEPGLDFAFQEPIARFADAEGATQVVVTANGHVGVGTEAPNASLAVRGSTDEQQAIARFSKLKKANNPLTEEQTKVIITAKGNVGIGTDSPTASLMVQGNTDEQQAIARFADKTNQTKVIITAEGNVGVGKDIPGSSLDVQGTIKADNLILPPTSRLEAGTFSGHSYQLQQVQAEQDELIFGSIEAYSQGQEHKEIQFIGNKEQGVNFAFLDGDIRIEKSDTTPAHLRVQGVLEANSLKLGQRGVTVTQFVDTFPVLGTDVSGIVPTIHAVNSKLNEKAALNGSPDVAFRTQDLTVSGILKFAQKGVGITEFTNTLNLPPSSNPDKAVPTVHAIKDYIVPQLTFKADRTYVDERLATVATQSEVDRRLSTKVDKDYVNEQLSKKAKLTGDTKQDFSIQDLTVRDVNVNGALTLHLGEKVNEFSKADLEISSRNELAVSTAKATKEYIDRLLQGKANRTGDKKEEFEAQKLITGNIDIQNTLTLKEVTINQLCTVLNSERANNQTLPTAKAVMDYIPYPKGSLDQDYQTKNLTVSGGITIGSSQERTTEKLSVKGKTTTRTLTVTGNQLLNSGGATSPVLEVEGLARFADDITYHGNLLQESSRELKRNISDLSSKEVVELLRQLNPIKFSYNSDATERIHIGFISEDVPTVVASSDQRAVSISDIVGILVHAVKEQRQATMALANTVDRQKIEITKLQTRIKDLEEKGKHRFW